MTKIANLSPLLLAYDYARDAGLDVWDFALEVGELRGAGLTVSDLRWLVAKGYAEHAEDTSEYGQQHRSFQPGKGLVFLDATCFVLTTRGATFARRLVADSNGGEVLGNGSGPASNGSSTQEADESQVLPRWDHAGRELLVGDSVVKRYRVPAPNQELILLAFEEQGWPSWLDDPLPVCEDISPKRRLQNAINSLNRNQAQPLLRFHGNGNGNGISWELCEVRGARFEVRGARCEVRVKSEEC